LGTIGFLSPLFYPSYPSFVKNYNHWGKKSQVIHITYSCGFCYNDGVDHMAIRKSIKLNNNFSEIKKLNNFLEEYIQQNISNYQAIQLSLEEIFNNILLYAYPDSQVHEINFQFIIDNTAIRIYVEDDGIPFNPLNVNKPETTSPLQERKVGGLGIHLVRSLMDELSYQRSNNKNILFIKKNLNG